MRKQHLIWIVCLALGCTACGGNTHENSPSGGGSGGAPISSGGGASGTGASAGADSGRDGSGACASFIPKATPDAIAKTPRTNESAELLAIETSNEFVAPDALYTRIDRELPAIEQVEPAVVGIQAWSAMNFDGGILLVLDSATYQAYQSGTYTNWDCQNQAYGMSEINDIGMGSFVSLRFGAKRYNTPLLAAEYKALSGVLSADPNANVGDRSDVCLEIRGDTHLYIYDKAGGDCPSGCAEHFYYGFEVAPGPLVKALGTYDPTLRMPEPAWFSDLSDCLTRL